MRTKRRAVLLDVDGIIVELVDHFGEFGVSPRLVEEIRVVPNLGEMFGRLTKLGFLIIGHSNQPDMARGKITPEFLQRKHDLVLEAYPQIRKVFFCPHTEANLCGCRKPKPGLLLQAAREFRLDLRGSWVVGDSRRDIEAGKLVQSRTVFVQTKYNCGNVAIAIATGVVVSPRGAFELICNVEEGIANQYDL